jgi:phosphoribosylformylglycinamidine cyclo-ligase
MMLNAPVASARIARAGRAPSAVVIRAPTVVRQVKVAATMTPGEELTYKKAGVDIDAGDELVRRIQKMNPSIGGFSGMVPFGDSFLVAGTDGVGTKLRLAFDLNKHDTVGIDLVAMSVNDVVCSGAQPMFFLDYFACGALDVDQAESVIKGIVEGCKQSNCILLGGETAEMPGFYQKGEYDLAGFAVASVKKDKVIDGKVSVKPGNVMMALPSSGVHSNGFSLARKVLEVTGTTLQDKVPWGEKTFGEVLLVPTIIYVPTIVELHDKVGLNGVVHITGGGMPENIPRVLAKGVGVEINTAAYKVPELFTWMQKSANIPTDDLRRTFNMGIGMVFFVDPSQVEACQKIAPESFVLGNVVAKEGIVFV